MTPHLDHLQAIRIVLVAPSHPGNVGGAARAMHTMGLARLVLVNPRRHPDPEAVALASGATAVLDGAQVVTTLDAALAGCVIAVGLSARPREFAGRVLAVREAAVAGDRACRPRRRRARVRHRDVGAVQRRARALRHRRHDSGECRLRVAQSRGGGAGRRVRAAYRGYGRRGLARASVRARDGRRDRGPVRAGHGARSPPCVSSIRACRSACCRGCGGSSRAPRSRRRRSTSCAGSSPASISCCGGLMVRQCVRSTATRLNQCQLSVRTSHSDRIGKKTSSVTRMASEIRNGTTPRNVSAIGTSRARLLMM